MGRVRKTNEDCFGLSATISSVLEREEWHGELGAASGGWPVIADGMGGHEAGEVASRAVVDTVHRHSDRLQSEAGIVSILSEASAAIFENMATKRGGFRCPGGLASTALVSPPSGKLPPPFHRAVP